MPRLLPASPRQDLPPTAATRDALIERGDGLEVEDRHGFVIARLARSIGRIADPHYGLALDRAISVYESGRNGALFRRVQVFYALDDSDEALSAARLTARLLALHQTRFGRPAAFPRGEETASLWLIREPAPDPKIGGETRTNNIYVYGTATPRARMEWARTLAHEFGHLTLPGARGFIGPENDAAGFLGEKLFLSYLRTGQTSGDDFVQKADVDAFWARQSAPLRDRFRRLGPSDPLWKRRSAAAMELYIGAALAADEAFGSAVLGRALRGIEAEAPDALLTALRRAVLLQIRLTVQLPAWVPLVADRYAIAPVAGRGTLAIADRPAFVPRPGEPLTVRAPGWKWFRAASGDLKTVALSRLHG